ncbi:MAG: thiolase family protein [Akkermansiaceae bacterium]
MKQPLYIYEAIRTPFARMGSSLASLSATDLGTSAVSALLHESGVDPGRVSEVIMGCVAQPMDSANIARVVALRSGIPSNVIASTVHRNCASGMESITSAYERMLAGRGDLFVVGGAESMSNVPLLYNAGAVKKFGQLAKSKSMMQKLGSMFKFRPKDFSPVVALRLGLTDPFAGINMGQTAEVLARELGISREEQDAFAAESHVKALASNELLKEEIHPIYHRGNAIAEDNGIRTDSTPERLAKLRPVFEKTTGTVTAGNSSQITDGAAALLVGSESAGAELGLKPIAKINAYAYAGCDPERMGIGPLHAMERLFTESDYRLDMADVIEINEAFAAQVLACLKASSSDKFAKQIGLKQALGEIPMEKLNMRGGAIALGHPVGATGARLVLTAIRQLHEQNKQHALTTLCVGGGQGAAIWIEKI